VLQLIVTPADGGRALTQGSLLALAALQRRVMAAVGDSDGAAVMLEDVCLSVPTSAAACLMGTYVRRRPPVRAARRGKKIDLFPTRAHMQRARRPTSKTRRRASCHRRRRSMAALAPFSSGWWAMEQTGLAA
jgi:hypothetical protein